MTQPEVTTEVLDGGLGLNRQELNAISAAVGVCSSGTVNAIKFHSVANEAKAEFGTGPLVEKGAYHLVNSKKPLYMSRLNASVPGVVSAVTKSDPAIPTIVITGNPLDEYSFTIECTQTGSIAPSSASGAFRYTVDGGDTYTPEIALPAAAANTAAVRTGTVDLTTLTYAAAASHTGTTDLTTAGLYGIGGTLDGTEFDYTPQPAGSPTTTVTLTAPADAAALISQINTQLGAAIASNVADRLKLTSVDLGATGGFTIAAGAPDALAVLGLTAGTYTGTAGTLDGKGFTGTVTTLGAITVSFGTPANAAAVVSEVNADAGGTIASLNGSNQLVITSTSTGAASAVTLVAGAPDALATLGLTAGTTNGVDGTASYTLGDTGLAATLPQGTYTEGDTWTFTATMPSYALADLTANLDVWLADSQKQWFCLHVLGQATTAAAARAIADVLKTYADDAEVLHRFTFFVQEAPDVVRNDLITQYATFESRRVSVVYGRCELTSEATRDGGVKRIFNRSSAWPLVERLAEIEISESAAFVGRGKLKGVQSVDQDELDAASQMDDARFLALREVIGLTGYYVNQPRIMAPAGSDFSFIEYRRIMDVGCRIAREHALQYLNGKVLVDPTTGFIAETSARAIEDDIRGALEAELVSGKHASSVTVVVKRDENILSTQKLIITIAIVPPGYARAIEQTLSFLNPFATG